MRPEEKIRYVSDSGASALLEFGGQYRLLSADGIDGLENDVYTVKGSGQDGESYVGQSVQPRKITLTGSIKTNKEVARRSLLSIFNPKHKGKLIYSNDRETWYIPCEITRAPVFTPGVYLKFQVTVTCPYPYFRAGDGSAQNADDIALWLGDLEFGDLELNADSILGHRSASLIINVENKGDVDAGIVAEFRALGSTANPSLVNVQTQETLSLTISLVADDVVRINTGYREKRAVLIRGGVESSIFNLVDVGSTWLQLHPGDNLIRYDATVTDNVEVTIYHDDAYLGV